MRSPLIIALLTVATASCTHFIGASDAPPPQVRPAAPPPPPSSLPKTIDIATPTQAVNTFYEYAIAGGLLYQRKDAKEAWALIDGVGLPNVDGQPMKELKGKLTRVFADGNIVAVVDEGDQVFRFDTNLATFNFEPTLYGWRTDWGGGLLKIRKDLRSLSYGRRTILNVGTIEDRFGYKSLAANPASLLSVFHENGYSGLMHFYGISQDGHRLYFADNGLTNVFNYEFDTPRADDFEGVSVASSASMVVLLDTKGRLWAKFLDFDWYGSNPMMFEYSYVDENGGKQPEPEGFGVVHIPLPTWKELPPPQLPQGAWISTEMGMRVTGSANFARELRIRGRDAGGACGLWITELDKPAQGWRFENTGICADEKTRFTAVTDAPKVARGKELGGALVIDGGHYLANLSDYTLVDSPLRFELRDAASHTVVWQGLLHLVPAWSPSVVVDPGRDGRYKMFYATVEADAAYKDTPFSRAHDLKTFDFAAYGSLDELVIKPLRDDRASGTLTSAGMHGDVVAAFLAQSSSSKESVAGACRDLEARVDADVQQMTKLVLATPALNAFGLVTGTRFWYYHGISMIPPLGRLMDWGTRLFYDRYKLARYEQRLVHRHCAP